MTKKYTLNLLISEVSNLKGGKTTKAIYTALSPRAGRSSVKFRVLNSFLGGKLQSVLTGKTVFTGKTPRTRLLRALRARKAN